MDQYIASLQSILICGIEAQHWRGFLSIFQDNTTPEQAKKALQRLRLRVRTIGPHRTQAIDQSVRKIGSTRTVQVAHSAVTIVDALEQLLDNVGG